jgi:hypothetical protein
MFARLSASRDPAHAVCAFAGGARDHTILSACEGTLLPFLTTRTALPLRAACKDARAAIAAHPWRDLATVVRGHLGPSLREDAPQQGAWRACFPRARAANVQSAFGASPRRPPLTDEDFAHLAGVQELIMSGSAGVTGAGFVHLRGSLLALDMSRCPGVTDAAFAHLRGLRSLDMTLCTQVTDGALAQLAGGGLRVLAMGGCSQPSLTSAAFEHLGALQELAMPWCSQPALGNAALAALGGSLRSLDASFCSQATLTDEGFAHLGGLEALRVCGCRQLTAGALAPLAGTLRSLDASFAPELCANDAVAPLVGLRTLTRLAFVSGRALQCCRGQRVGALSKGPPPPSSKPFTTYIFCSCAARHFSLHCPMTPRAGH